MAKSADSTPVIQTVGLSKVFRDFWGRKKVWAVKDLDLTVQPGEIFGLLGPNGSGKSTAIKMLLGLLFPTHGRIAVFGRAPTDVAVKARIGFLPEESYLYRFLNARETLDFYGRLFQQPGRVRGERIEKLLEMVGLKHEAKRRIGEYSKGMARRIGLAQALINDPELLILDEPTSGLDPIGTRQIKDVIRELGKMGKTILLSSHLLQDVEDVCDRVAILYGGQHRVSGDIASLLAQNDQVQITSEHLSDATVEQIRELVQRLERKQILSVNPPRDRLENLFLRIVQQAQTANVVTSGARGAGQMADFLGTGGASGNALIDNLVAASDRRAAPAGPDAVAPVRVAGPSRAVIAQLVESNRAAMTPTDGRVEPVAPAAVRPSTPPDRGVIDALLKKHKE